MNETDIANVDELKEYLKDYKKYIKSSKRLITFGIITMILIALGGVYQIYNSYYLAGIINLILAIFNARLVDRTRNNIKDNKENILQLTLMLLLAEMEVAYRGKINKNDI